MNKISIFFVIAVLSGCRQEHVFLRENKKTQQTVHHLEEQYDTLFRLARRYDGASKMERREVQREIKEVLTMRSYEYRQQSYLGMIDPVARYPFVYGGRDVDGWIAWLKKRLVQMNDEQEKKRSEKLLRNLYLLQRVLRNHPAYRKEHRQYQELALIGNETNATGIEIEELKRSVFEEERGMN